MKKDILRRIGFAVLLGAFLVGLLPAPTTPRSHAERGNEAPPPPKTIAETLKPFVDSHSLAGAVTLVANKDKVLSLEAIGYADLSSSRPMLIDAIFWIASMSKPITAAALMILVDEGKVKLDDPVEKYLPEFKNIRVAAEKGKDPKELRKPNHPITVREVLSHTSGLLHVSPEEKPTIDVLPLKDAVASYTKTPLLFQPGASWQYSNAGINTAGRIIEVVSGMAYEDFLDKHLFGPLGMKDTTFWPSEAQLKRLAKSYKPNKAKTDLEETTVTPLKYPLSDRKRHPCPGGGLFSTASDCGVFCQMVLNGGVHKGKRILSEAAIKEMTSKQTGAGIKQSYGLGWGVKGESSFGHGGAFATDMTIDTKRGLITVWMVQQSGGFPNNGGQSQGAFRKAAEELYGNSSK
jgi:CubicO group peptidase (beta-lactamase class C family)